MSTPRGATLVSVLSALRHEGSTLTKAELVRRVFSPDSGIETSALSLRFAQQLKRVETLFDMPGQSEALHMHVEVLSTLQELACQPSVISLISLNDCHKETLRVLEQVVRVNGVSPDNAVNAYNLWVVCKNML